MVSRFVFAPLRPTEVDHKRGLGKVRFQPVLPLNSGSAVPAVPLKHYCVVCVAGHFVMDPLCALGLAPDH